MAVRGEMAQDRVVIGEVPGLTRPGHLVGDEGEGQRRVS
jgi:hypothetical protein